MLAVTYDRRAGEVAHYVNGNQISLELIPEHATVPCINLNAASIESAMSMISGTARSMGLLVE